jgi:hypothetical protein
LCLMTTQEFASTIHIMIRSQLYKDKRKAPPQSVHIS